MFQCVRLVWLQETLFFKSRVGLHVEQIYLAEADKHSTFCLECMECNGIYSVEDTLLSKHRTNSLVTSFPNIRSYIGLALITPSGYKIGTLCVMDIVPRKLTHEQIQVLRVLGTQVISQLELRNHIKTSFKLQQDLFEKNKRLEELDKQRVRFLGMISHDLRQSVCAVQVSSEILLQGEPKEEHQELLESISNSSNYMGSLLDELLDELHLSKSIRNAPPIFKVVEPVSIIKRNVLANSRVAERKNIEISLTINDSVKMDGNLRINMDVSKMERVLNNLISNAMKFSHSGTNIRVHLKKSNSHFKIQVEDEGQAFQRMKYRSYSMEEPHQLCQLETKEALGSV